jgi:hypothetical protein
MCVNVMMCECDDAAGQLDAIRRAGVDMNGMMCECVMLVCDAGV